jgi:hypothetical protein
MSEGKTGLVTYPKSGKMGAAKVGDLREGTAKSAVFKPTHKVGSLGNVGASFSFPKAGRNSSGSTREAPKGAGAPNLSAFGTKASSGLTKNFDPRSTKPKAL